MTLKTNHICFATEGAENTEAGFSTETQNTELLLA